MQINENCDQTKCKFRTIIKIELQKMLKNRETFLAFSMILIPLFYSIALSFRSPIFQYLGHGNVDYFSFVHMTIAVSAIAMIFHAIFAFFAARFYGSEIENHSILLYVPRLRDRKKMFLAKSLSLQILLLVSFVTFALICIPCYILLASARPDIANGNLVRSDLLAKQGFVILSILLSFSTTIAIIMFLCSYMKFIPAVGLFLGFRVICKLVENFAIIKYLSPFFYYVELSKTVPDSGISGSLELPEPILLLINILLVLIYETVFTILGTRKFCDSDLS